MLFQAESADEAPSDFGAFDFVASDVGVGTEDTYASIFLRVAGRALDEKYRFGSTAGDGFTAIFDHAVTADRTFTFPDATTTVVGTDVTQTLTNKTLTSPTENTPVLTLETATPTAAARLAYSGGFGRLGDGVTSQVLVSEGQTQTLAAKTLTTPTISATGFTNATHAHAAANSGGQIAHTDLTSIGTNTHAQIDTHLAASAAVHGLPASTYVQGTRVQEGEWITHGNGNRAAAAGVNAVSANGSVPAVTFGVAFAAEPRVLGGGTTSNAYNIAATYGITTTGFSYQSFDISDRAATACGWQATGK